MAVTIIKEWKITFDKEFSILVYSDHDLSTLHILMRSAKHVRPTGRTGLGSDGVTTHDGKLFEPVLARERE
jgi:hypothetical protein